MIEEKQELVSRIKQQVDEKKLLETAFSNTQLIDKIIEKCKTQDIDWFIVISGGEGIGKSTLALNIYSYICKKLNLPIIDTLSRTLIYDEDEFLQFLVNVNPEEKNLPILLDEGANILFNRESMNKYRHYILKFFNVMRFLNCFVIITTPNIKFLDKNVREHRIKSLFHIPERGIFWYYNKSQIERMLAIETQKRWIWIEPQVVGSFRVNPTLNTITTLFKQQYIKYFSKKVSSFLNKKLQPETLNLEKITFTTNQKKS
ncbi:MAG: zonular occludens toxin domain-containing protein [Candidatus Aenigmatarchaeota archaeon]